MKKELILNAAYKFEENDEGGLKGNFSGVAYSGKPIEQYGWMQNLIIDLSDIKFKKSVPILSAHDHKSIAGNAKLKVVDNQLLIDGKLFKQSAHAAEIKALAEDGFEWELSVGLGPEAKMTRLDEGAEMVVNGKKIKGPANVIGKAHVSEVSFVAIGADRSASANVFKEKGKEGEIEMDQNKEEKNTVKGVEFSNEEWAEIVLACGCEAGAGKKEVKAKATEDKDKMKKMEAEIAKLKEELKKYKAGEKKKQLMEAAEGKIDLSEEKVEELMKDEVKLSSYIEFLADLPKKEVSKEEPKTPKAKIAPKFAEVVNVEAKETVTNKFSSSYERQEHARKLVAEGKFKNFREAIASLPVEIYED